MKKTLISAALVAAFGLTAIGNAAAADGKITFTGMITDVTCTVKGGTGTDGAAQNFTVALPTVSTTALNAVDKVAGETPFEVILGASGQTGCTNGKIASLRFEPLSSPVNQATGRLVNQAAGGATQVEVELLNKAKAPINLYTNAGGAGSEETIAGNTATLKYGAQYHATVGASTAGAVNTFVNYSVTYR